MSDAPSYVLAVSSAIEPGEIEAVAAAVATLSDGRFWNFIPGIFAFRSTKLIDEVSDLIQEVTEEKFLLLPIDPVMVQGVASGEGWNSWFFDIFGDKLEETATRRGWMFERMREDQERYLENK